MWLKSHPAAIVRRGVMAIISLWDQDFSRTDNRNEVKIETSVLILLLVKMLYRIVKKRGFFAFF